ncbi:hypothetical protein [Chishuiella sp.]|uniref:hypothetical protein n=1 Tax=Chishuiella sp. TaxID=1969467 RepID=UPI0028AE0A96|nr:hypothetical protein [Chishuiella sp.]
MKNLENLNLQELSFEEQTNTDGGVVYSLIGNASSWLARQLNDFGRGFVEGFNG